MKNICINSGKIPGKCIQTYTPAATAMYDVWSLPAIKCVSGKRYSPGATHPMKKWATPITPTIEQSMTGKTSHIRCYLYK